jgi:hypothetical protein
MMNNQMNTSAHIRQYIQKTPRGTPFSSSALLKYGSRASIDKTLSRLTTSKKIVRVTRGVYVRPKINPYIGEVLPEPLSIVKTIAKKTGSTVQVHGAEAIRQFGFTTQVPAHPVFYTTGPSRQFMLGNLEITLKHISPRKLVFPESRVGLAILALWYLSKKQVTPHSIEMIKRKLTRAEFEKFKSSTEHMPGWMIEAVVQYKKKTIHD